MACWSQTALNGLWHEISLEKTVPELWNRLHPELTGVSPSVCFDSRWPKTIPCNLWYPQADSCKLLPGVASPTLEAWTVTVPTGEHREFIRPGIVLIYKEMSESSLANWLVEMPAWWSCSLCICLYVWRQVLLCNPDWPVTQRDASASATPVVVL